MVKFIQVELQIEKPVAYLEHKATKCILPVYTPIGWFKRFMLCFCFGLKYNKEVKL